MRGYVRDYRLELLDGLAEKRKRVPVIPGMSASAPFRRRADCPNARRADRLLYAANRRYSVTMIWATTAGPDTPLLAMIR